VITASRCGNAGSGRLQPCLELLERAAQRAFAGFLHVVQHQLILAAGLVQRDPAARQHPHALARGELQPGALGLEHGAADLRARVLEGEVQVPGGRAGDVAQFGLDPDRREAAFQQVAGQGVELGRGEDVACWQFHRTTLPHGASPVFGTARRPP
jgi:hypothetical protein